jgi:methylmalonyl-CoA/ethylmalonyl-CoA epimerase
MIGGLNHIALLVADLEASIARFERALGARLIERSILPESGTEVAVLEVGGVHLELLSARGEDTKVGRLLRERGEGIHHLSFHATGLEAELARLRELGACVLDPQPRVGLHGRKIAFLNLGGSGEILIELAEEPNERAQEGGA